MLNSLQQRQTRGERFNLFKIAKNGGLCVSASGQLSPRLHDYVVPLEGRIALHHLHGLWCTDSRTSMKKTHSIPLSKASRGAYVVFCPLRVEGEPSSDKIYGC